MRESVFIFGLGYVGVRLGLACQRELGWHVTGSCRSAEKADALRAAHGIEAHTFDLDEEYSGLDGGGLAALTCTCSESPPTAIAARTSVWRPRLPVISWIWIASSRVGVTTSTRVAATRRGR